MRIVRGLLAWVVVVSTLVTGGAAITPAEERTCLPDGGHEFVLDTERARLAVTAHVSPVGAGGTGALGVGLDGSSDGRTVLVYRTGIVRTDAAGAADGGLLDGFAFAFDAGVRAPVGASAPAVDVDHGRVDDTIDTAC